MNLENEISFQKTKKLYIKQKDMLQLEKLTEVRNVSILYHDKRNLTYSVKNKL